MFKFFYKKLLVTILSMALLNLNMMVLAQDVLPKSSPVSASGKITGIKDESGMMSSITMIAIGFLATRLYKAKKTTDIYLAMAGGVAFIAGEVLSTSTFKDISKDMEVPSGPPDSAQLEALTKLKKSYDAAKKSTNTKKMLQMAAAGAFGIAGVTAYFMKTQEVALEQTTDAKLDYAIAHAQKAIPVTTASCSSSGVDCDKPAKLTQAAATLTKIKTEKKIASVKRDSVVQPSLQSETDFNSAKVKTLADFQQATAGLGEFRTPVDLAQSSFQVETNTKTTNNSLQTDVGLGNEQSDSLGPSPTDTPPPAEAPAEAPPTEDSFPDSTAHPAGYQSIKSSTSVATNFFEKILNFAFPSAQAGTMGLLMVGGGVALGVLVGMCKSLSKTIDDFLFAPKKRGIIWGVLAGLSFMASSSSTKTMKKIEDNLKKIDEILKGVKDSTSNGVTIGNSSASSTPTTLADSSNSITASSTPVAITPTIDPAIQPNLATATSTPPTNLPINTSAAQVNLATATSAPVAGTSSAQVNLPTITNPSPATTTSATDTSSLQANLPTTPVATSSQSSTTTSRVSASSFGTPNASGAVQFHPTQRTSCLDKAGDTNCKSIKSMAMAMPSFRQLPASIQTLASNALSMGDGLSGTNVLQKSTQTAIISLASDQPYIAKMLDMQKINLNKQLVQSKLAPINFDKEQDIFLKYITNDVEKTLQEHKMSPNQFLASIGPSLYLGTSTKKDILGTGNAAPAFPDQGNQGQLNATAKPQPQNLSKSTIESTKSTVGGVAATDATNEHDFDIGTNDINTDSKASIFELISTRYFKSAYRKLLDEEPIEQK